MKNILITGCSTGFGFNSAKYLAQKGHHIYASMRNVGSKNADAASNLKEYAASNTLKIEVLEIDVTSDESVNTAVSGLSKVDVLINNAGRGFGGPIEAFSSQECLAQLDLNIVGTLRVANAVLPKMRAQGSGLIIQVSSIAGRLAAPGFGVYHASKWGLEGLSETLRYELAPLGIDVVIVEPGPFATDFFPTIIPAANEEIASAYQHVGEFSENFGNQVLAAFEDANAPTDPMIVVKTFEKLIETPTGNRPLRTIAGMDFGVKALNEAVEPHRKGILQALDLAECDGPSPKKEPKVL